MINTETMTMSEMFGHMMAARGVTRYHSTLYVMQALVDTTRQASKEWAQVAKMIIEDFCDGKGWDYTEALGAEPGEYVNTETGEVISVPMIP